MTKNNAFILFLSFISFSFAYGQKEQDSLLTQQIQEIEVTASRLDGKDTRLPAAINIIGQSQIQQAQPQLALNEGLNFVPGLFALNPDNFAQDLRISIRGFGARAAFGIRGIRIMVDGLPETTPDGQSQVDNLDLGILQQIEVIRGPASGLYGNASGGVLNVKTENPTEAFSAEGRLLGGAFGLQQYQLKAGQQIGKFGYLIHGTHTSMNGYRENSGVQNTLFNGKFTLQLPQSSTLTLILNHVDSPQADDPGGITRTDITENRRQAREQNLQFKAGEEVVQSKAGFIYEGQFAEKHRLQARLFYLNRDFKNRLPFGFGGIVDLQRAFYGGGAMYAFKQEGEKFDYRLRAGVDIETQIDDRLRFVNLEGEQGALTLDQEEAFSNTGLFLLQDFTWQKLMINLGLRYDIARLEATDRFLSDGDDSGQIDLNNFNPIFGLSFAFSPAINVYGNFSTSFETPTLNELSNDPEDNGGFNDQLEPQKAYNFEIGLKGSTGSRFKYSLAAFYIDLENEFIPFELEAFPDRTFYRNAGNSSRRGLELEGNYLIASGLIAQLSYTFSDFQYDDFNTADGNLDGNRTPGIPQHLLAAGFRYFAPSGFFSILQAQHVGELYVNDANTEKDNAYTLVNLRAGHTFSFPNWTLSPFFGLNNLLNTSYNSNIRINAFGGRYYEPGAERNGYVGVRVRFGK